MKTLILVATLLVLAGCETTPQQPAKVDYTELEQATRACASETLLAYEHRSIDSKTRVVCK